jgi:hypothetical protein
MRGERAPLLLIAAIAAVVVVFQARAQFTPPPVTSSNATSSIAGQSISPASVTTSSVDAGVTLAGDGTAANPAFELKGHSGNGLFWDTGSSLGCFSVAGVGKYCYGSGALVPFSSGGLTLGLSGTRWGNVFSSGTYSSSIASTNDAFAVGTNGAYVHFGTGANDRCSSNGTTVTCCDASGCTWAIFGGFSAANGNFLVNGSTGAITLVGGGSASNGFTVTGGALQAVAGTSSTNYSVVTTLKVDSTVNGSGADTTEDDLTKFSIVAGSLSANGKTLHFSAWGDNNSLSTTDVITVRCYFGNASTLKSGTLLVSRVITASQASTWNVQADIIRTGSATEVASATLNQGGTTTAMVQTNSSPSGDTTGAMLVGCTGQRATSSVANSVRQLGLILTENN